MKSYQSYKLLLKMRCLSDHNSEPAGSQPFSS
jgi:hypothetical protein